MPTVRSETRDKLAWHFNVVFSSGAVWSTDVCTAQFTYIVSRPDCRWRQPLSSRKHGTRGWHTAKICTSPLSLSQCLRWTKRNALLQRRNFKSLDELETKRLSRFLLVCFAKRKSQWLLRQLQQVTGFRQREEGSHKQRCQVVAATVEVAHKIQTHEQRKVGSRRCGAARAERVMTAINWTATTLSHRHNRRIIKLQYFTFA